MSLCPGNNISARKRKHGRTGDAGTYIKPMLIQAAWSAIRVRGRLQARYNRLVRRFGGQKNPAAKKKAITAIAHTLLKIAYQVLKSGTPYQDLGADFYTGWNSPEEQQKYLERQLQRLHTLAARSPSPSARRRRPYRRRVTASPDFPESEPPPSRHPGHCPPDNQRHPAPLPPHRPGLAAARPPGTQFSCQQFPSLVKPMPSPCAATATYSWPFTCAVNGACPAILITRGPHWRSMMWKL